MHLRSAEAQTKYQTEEKNVWQDSERSMVVGWCCIFQKLLIYWDFPTQLSLGFTERSEKGKISTEHLSLSEVRGVWLDCLQLVERQ